MRFSMYVTDISEDADRARTESYERIPALRAVRAATDPGKHPRYWFKTLTKAVSEKDSPLKQYFEQRFPALRPMQDEFRSLSGDLLVESGPANAGTLGTAFDCLVRFLLDPDADVPLAYRRFEKDRPAYVEVIREVVASAQAAAHRGEYGQDDLVRACWALALCIEVYRTRVIFPGTPLAILEAENRFTAEGLLSTAPADGVRQLTEMRMLADTNLTSKLTGPYVVGPTSKEIGPCAADADLIAGGCLIDLKTRRGTKRARAGFWYDGLAKTEIYQLLGYVMFDTSDSYEIKTIGIYSARYGTLATWPLQDALESMADSQVDLVEERQKVRAMIYA